jgi:hypothetical protein
MSPLVFGALAMVAWGCSGCHCSGGDDGPRLAPEAGLDTLDTALSTVDSGETGAVDSSVDVAPDALVADTTDTPFVGEWRHPVVAPACDSLIASSPATSVEKTRWVPCPSGRIGCQRLDTAWSAKAGPKINIPTSDPVRLVAGAPHLHYVRLYPRGDHVFLDFAVEIVESLAGKIEVAVGTDDRVGSSCNLPVSVGEYGITVSGRNKAYPDSRIVMWSRWSDLGSFEGEVVANAAWGLPAGSKTSGMTVGVARFFVGVNGGGIVLYDPAARKALAPTPSMPFAEMSVPVKGGSIALDLATPHGVMFIGNDGTFSTIAPSASPHVPTWLAVDRGAADTIVWVESDDAGGGSYVSSILWSSPYATTATAMVPRKIAKLPDGLRVGGRDLIVNGGIAVVLSDARSAIVYRLSDGLGWTLKSEPDDVFGVPVWVDDDEVWLSVANVAFPNEVTSIVRLPRPTGPTDVASGL